VELLLFNGILNKDGSVRVYWEVASEVNCNYYELLKSYDCIDFSIIDRVQSKHNSNSIVSYEIIDKEKFNGIRYYKLKQVDFDGNKKFYGPINVISKVVEGGEFKIYPNPNNGEFYISLDGLNSNEKVKLVIRDMKNTNIYDEWIELNSSGYYRKLYQPKVELTKGIYILKIERVNSELSTKLIVE